MSLFSSHSAPSTPSGSTTNPIITAPEVRSFPPTTGTDWMKGALDQLQTTHDLLPGSEIQAWDIVVFQYSNSDLPDKSTLQLDWTEKKLQIASKRWNGSYTWFICEADEEIAEIIKSVKVKSPNSMKIFRKKAEVTHTNEQANSGAPENEEIDEELRKKAEQLKAMAHNMLILLKQKKLNNYAIPHPLKSTFCTGDLLLLSPLLQEDIVADQDLELQVRKKLFRAKYHLSEEGFVYYELSVTDEFCDEMDCVWTRGDDSISQIKHVLPEWFIYTAMKPENTLNAEYRINPYISVWKGFFPLSSSVL